MKTVTRTIFSLVVVIFSAMIIQAQIVDTTITLKDAINIDNLRKLSIGKEEKRKYFVDCEPHHNSLFTGIDTAYFITNQGKIEVILEYENGEKVKATGYYENGNKYWEANFNGETLHGLDIVYFKNGNKKYQRYCENGKQIYPVIMWYESGNISQIGDVNEKMGKEKTVRLYESGKLESVTIIGVDSLQSLGYEEATLEKLYYESGGLMEETIWNAGRQKYVDYYENGQKASDGYIYDWAGYQLGKWTVWHDNGQLKRIYIFNDSIPNYKHGVWKWWDELGGVTREEEYKANELVRVENFLRPKQYEGNGTLTKELTLSGKETLLKLSYEFYKEPDEIIVYDQNGNELHRTGMRATTKEVAETIIIYNVTKLVFRIESKTTNSKWKFLITVE